MSILSGIGQQPPIFGTTTPPTPTANIGVLSGSPQAFVISEPTLGQQDINFEYTNDLDITNLDEGYYQFQYIITFTGNVPENITILDINSILFTFSTSAPGSAINYKVSIGFPYLFQLVPSSSPTPTVNNLNITGVVYVPSTSKTKINNILVNGDMDAGSLDPINYTTQVYMTYLYPLSF